MTLIRRIEPKLNSKVADLINDRHLLINLKQQNEGPLHLLFPRLMNDNVQALYAALRETKVDYKIFFAHKSTKSKAFLKECLRIGLGIDVASKNELCNALNVGFRGDNAECTGIKNTSFLQLALHHRCQLVADSIPELERIARTKQALGIQGQVPVLVRLSEVAIQGRSIQNRISRFGVAKEDFGAVLQFFRQNPELLLHGFHLHNDERESDIRAGHLEGLLHLMIDSYKAGFTPSVVNIGGGLRRPQLAHSNQWSEFIEQLEEDLTKGTNDKCWRGYAYGMRLNDRGKVVGRGQAIAMCSVPEMTNVIRDMFALGDIEGKSNGDFIRDNGFQVFLEPGQAMLEQCAISLFEVIETKIASGGQTLIVVDGNMYNLSTSMREYLMDPFLISNAENPIKEDFECFIVGSLCREEDFLMKRKVSFDRVPQPGDLICFANTAAYRIDFEDASPHQHTVGKRSVASYLDDRWQFCSEEAYDPYQTIAERDPVQDSLLV